LVSKPKNEKEKITGIEILCRGSLEKCKKKRCKRCKKKGKIKGENKREKKNGTMVEDSFTVTILIWKDR
jgi:hypothetical protein